MALQIFMILTHMDWC